MQSEDILILNGYIINILQRYIM